MNRKQEATLERVFAPKQVVVERTGIFGWGRPIFWGGRHEFRSVEEPRSVMTLTKEAVMWYPHSEHGEKVVNGSFVAKVRVIPCD